MKIDRLLSGLNHLSFTSVNVNMFIDLFQWDLQELTSVLPCISRFIDELFTINDANATNSIANTIK